MIQKLKYLFARKFKVTGKKLPLIHVHTFKNGTNLYTYNTHHYGYIASRYFKAINELFNNLLLFNTDKSTFDKSLDSIKDKLKLIASGSCDITDEAMQAYSVVEYLKSLPNNRTAINLSIQETLFCMFYLIDEEIEGGYNQVLNKRKLELISEDEYYRDFFFQNVEDIMKNLQISYESGTVETMKVLAKYL